MLHYTRIAVAMLLLMLIASCGGSGNHALDSTPEAQAGDNQLAGGESGNGGTGLDSLPELPSPGLSLRSTQATEPYQFGTGDLYNSSLASFNGSELGFETGGLAWAIIGVNGSGESPTVLDLTGSLSGYYVAVSDYGQGCWYWLGGPYSGNEQLTLPGGQWCDGSGAFYIAIVRPDGATGGLSVSATLKTPAEWNVLVWINGDNDLAPDGVDDLNEMEAVGSTENVRVLAGYDINSEYVEGTVSGIDNVHFIKVVADSDEDAINTTGDTANQSFPRSGYNSADPENLVTFLEWAETNFPANHTMLVLWNHGDGWMPGCGCAATSRGTSGILVDESDGDNNLTDNTAIASALAGRHFDILGYDACTMGCVEALYDYRGLADYYIASQITEPGGGWDYTGFLTAWRDEYPLSATQIGSHIVDTYVQYYEGESTCTLAVVDGVQFENLVKTLGSLATEVRTKASQESDNFKQAISSAHEPEYYDGGRDLLSFLDAYAGITSDTSIQSKIDAVESAAQSTILHFAQEAMPNCNGLCLWLPTTSQYNIYQSSYSTLGFSAVTHWLELLNAVGVPDGGSVETQDAPLLAWQPQFIVECLWENPQTEMSPMCASSQGHASATPESPEGLSGTVQFSEPSTTSGVAKETVTLLAGAPVDSYTIYIQYDGTEQVSMSARLLDDNGDLVRDFGTFELGTGNPPPIIANLFYNDGSLTETTWSPGYYVKADWGNIEADFDLTINTPNGKLGSPYSPEDIDNIIEFSPESGDDYTDWESGTLLDTAPNGLFVVSIEYYDFYSEPLPSTITVSLDLYNAGDELVRNLGNLVFDGNAYEDDYIQYGALITY